jgi:hypothetical protein
LFDRKYCCDRHRKTARKLSARALRDANDADELEEPWLITAGPRVESRRSGNGTGFSPVSGLLLVVVIIFVVLVAPPSNSVSPTTRPQTRSFPFADRLQELIPGRPTTSFVEDFQAGLGDWQGRTDAVTGSSGWSWEGTRVQLGRLRLWTPTLKMSNYQVVFQGAIEEKAMGLTYRASDLDNYYASKISLGRGTNGERPEIIRFVMVDGKEYDRVALPLPVPLEKDVPYQVRVRVKADRFSTMINGQRVDTWRDDRHPSGGVGFFSEPGERASINWIRITDGEGLFDSLLSFSLVVTPQELLRAIPQ